MFTSLLLFTPDVLICRVRLIPSGLLWQMKGVLQNHANDIIVITKTRYFGFLNDSIPMQFMW